MQIRHLYLLVVLLLSATAHGQSIREIQLPSSDLAYDPATRRIFASVPSRAGTIGNSVISIDPKTGEVGRPIFVGSEPGKLAVSDRGEYLYVALEGAADGHLSA